VSIPGSRGKNMAAQSFSHEKGSREVQVAPSRGFNGENCFGTRGSEVQILSPDHFFPCPFRRHR
jgi:hypothetical protein